MPRCGRFRSYIREVAESPQFEKLSFVLPFLVLIVELILLEHALSIQVSYVIDLTIILLILSFIEIIFVAGEIHEHYLQNNFDQVLTIRLDDFILKRRVRNVKYLVEEFINAHPHYSRHRHKIYHIACQIMETHKEDAWEKDLRDKLKRFIKRRKKMNVNDIITAFLAKYPVYKKYPGRIYVMACEILGIVKEKKK